MGSRRARWHKACAERQTQTARNRK